MQNNVTELTQRLLRSLDSNYNVIDMPAVIEIISLLEKVTITKELLETTRLGKYVNQLRRNTSNDSLARRAKELVKKWRDMVLPDSNGQLKPNDHHPASIPPQQAIAASDEQQPATKKRPAAKEPADNLNIKRTRVNGQMSELDFSDNSNSSFKDVLMSKTMTTNIVTTTTVKPVIVINSDSNSSVPDTKQEPLLEQQQPKKRGRKKGSKNHKNLIEEAETSFSNKLNVSRGNAKVKTTQELLADLHIRNSAGGNNSTGKPMDDLNERAAKLTERVSIIDQKLNANSNRYRNSQKKLGFKNNLTMTTTEGGRGEVLESGAVTNLRTSIVNLRNADSHGEDEIIIVDDPEPSTVVTDVKLEPSQTEQQSEMVPQPKSLTVEEARALLPPVDPSVLEEYDPEPQCGCQLIEKKTTTMTDVSVVDGEDEDDTATKLQQLQRTFEFVEDDHCPAKTYLADKYRLDSETLQERVERLHTERIPNVNGNFSAGPCKERPKLTEDGLYVNVVPNVNTEDVPKFSGAVADYALPAASENFKKYSISEGDDVSAAAVAATKNCDSNDYEGDSNAGKDGSFCEWHEVLEAPSYDGEILRILPYVIID